MDPNKEPPPPPSIRETFGLADAAHRHHTCEECKCLVIDLEKGQGNPGTTILHCVRREDGGFVSAVYAINAAQKGCSLCSWILYPSRVDWESADNGDFKLYCKYHWVQISDNAPLRAEILEFGFKKEGELDGQRTRKRRCRFVVYKDKDPELPQMQLSSGEICRLARTWLGECCQSGQKPPPSGSRPRRIIKIDRHNGGDLKLMLVTDGEWKGPYAALSYSWGGSQTFMSTRSTVGQRESGIGFDELPKTLQDAVQVTNELGLTYLWVDSLCILQDEDGIDRRKEFLCQDDVYSGAEVTIAASRATNHREGFLNDIVFKLQSRGAGHVLLWKLRSPDAEEPLSKRAWAFQEYLLSNRILFFESYQLRWVCSCTTAHWNAGLVQGSLNTDQKDWYSNLQPAQDVNYQDGLPGKINNKNIAHAKTREEVHQSLREWYGQLERFSLRDITKPVDKFPAIVGVQLCHYRFLGKPPIQSGVWLPYPRGNGMRSGLGPWPVGIASSLLWTSTSRNSLKFFNPSWSWSSVDSSLNMSYCTRFLDAEPDFSVPKSAWFPSRTPTGRVYKRITVNPQIFDFNGQPITVSGRTQAATLSKCPNEKIEVTISGCPPVVLSERLLDVDLWSLRETETDIGTSWQHIGADGHMREFRKLTKLLTAAHVHIAEDKKIQAHLLRLYPGPDHQTTEYMVGLILLEWKPADNQQSTRNHFKEYIRIGVFDFCESNCSSDNPQKVWRMIQEGFQDRENLSLV